MKVDRRYDEPPLRLGVSLRRLKVSLKHDQMDRAPSGNVDGRQRGYSDILSIRPDGIIALLVEAYEATFFRATSGFAYRE
jgi:hypothetical protein